jgi:hypothetical protein
VCLGGGVVHLTLIQQYYRHGSNYVTNPLCNYIRFEAFTATECNKAFLGGKPCENTHRSEGCLSTSIFTLMMEAKGLAEILNINYILVRSIARVDINVQCDLVLYIKQTKTD